jgi:hypothetical protein
MLTPAMIDFARATHQSRLRDISVETQAAIPQDQVVMPNYAAPIGIASLAMIAIGLIVAWAGYLKGVRWTWFVMFVIVWVWAFPVFLLPIFQNGEHDLSLIAPTLKSAMSHSGFAREVVKVFVMFLLMVVALVLPLKTFFGQRSGPDKSAQASSDAPDGSKMPGN